MTDAQPGLFGELPVPPPRSSDDRARGDMLRTVEVLEAADVHPWSALLLGWQVRTFRALAQKLTPLDAAALTARLDAALDRLGPPQE